MKILFKIIFGFIASIVVIIVAIFVFTSGMSDTADKFLESARSEDHQKAQSYLSFYVKDDAAVIIQYLKDNSMDQFTSTSWGSRAIVNNTGNISGEITTKSEIINTRIKFIKENDKWKIYSIQKQQNKGINLPQEPSSLVQIELVRNSMKIFMASAREKSMDKFHAYISKFWKKQISVQQLDEIFGSIFNVKSDLTFLDNVVPKIDFSSIIKDDVLMLSGSFPNDTVTIYFSQKYIYEGVQWKLVGFDYSNKKSQ